MVLKDILKELKQIKYYLSRIDTNSFKVALNTSIIKANKTDCCKHELVNIEMFDKDSQPIHIFIEHYPTDLCYCKKCHRVFAEKRGR